MNELVEKLQRALDLGGNTHSISDVLDDIQKGTSKMWVSDTNQSAIIANVEDHPQIRVLFVWLAAGLAEEILEMAPAVYEWGRKQGCVRAELVGRKGWTRVMAAQGWKPAPLVTLVKEL